MKKLIFNHLKPQHYYFRLFLFFLIISCILAFSMLEFNFVDFETFILRVVVIFFLLLFIAVAIEFTNSGDYLSPLEIYDLEGFFRNFLDEISNNKNLDNIFNIYFNKYDNKSKKILIKIFSRYKKYFLSSIKKENDIYIITFINEFTLFRYFFFRFLAKKGIHKIFVKIIKYEFKIIRII